MAEILHQFALDEQEFIGEFLKTAQEIFLGFGAQLQVVRLGVAILIDCAGHELGANLL
jgi:hypothetical protein